MTTTKPTYLGKPIVLTFESGATFTTGDWWHWTQETLDMVVGIDSDGHLVLEENYGGKPFQWTVTDCCGASTTGTDYGVVCRACYNDTDLPGVPWGTVSKRI